MKGKYVLVVDNNKGIFLQDWQVKPVHNYYDAWNGYIVRLSRKFFKPYEFKFEFDDYYFDEADTFDSLKDVAASQNKTNIAFGHMRQ